MKFHDFSPFYRSGEGIRSKVSGDRLIDNPAVADAQGGSGASYSFDGTDDYVEVAHDASLEPGDGDFSASVWFKYDGSSTETIFLLNKRTTVYGDGWLILLVETSPGSGIYSVRFNLDDDAGNNNASAPYRVETPASGIADGEWHNITCVFDKDVGLTFYKDGVSLGSKAATQITGTVTAPTVNLRIGYYNEAGTPGYFDGQISQVRLHNRALSAAEVRASYNGQAVPYEYVGGKQDEQTSGTLTIGKSYRLKDWITSDDFTNVGAASNADGVEFTATGTTPTTWSNSSKVVQIGCVAEYLPSGINATRWVDTSGNNLHGTASTATAVNHTTGTLTLESGANLKMQDGGGIDFTNYTDGSVAGTSGLEVLKDYEEGTWTPVLTFVTTQLTTAVVSGSYTKIGDRVCVDAIITVSTLGPASGNASITGLPYNVSSGDYGAASVYAVGVSSSGQFSFHTNAGASSISCNEIADDGTRTSLNQGNFADGDQLIISVQYSA